jgi:hypothetical protein
MKAYNESLIRNQWVRQVVRDWTEKGLLSGEDRDAIHREYATIPYHPQWFVWIGLFIFSLICTSSGSILFIPFINIAGAENFLLPLYGMALFFLLNYLIRDRSLHFSGIDNAILYTILLCSTTLIGEIAFALGNAPYLFALCYLPILLFFAYRYGEPIIALGVFLDGLYVLAALAVDFSWSRLLLPFLLMAYSGLVWYWVRGFMQKERGLYWKTALRWVHAAALIVFYLAGNYGIVREGSAMINSISGPSPEVAFAPVFWVLTFGLPLLYIIAALRWKGLDFLTLGSLAFVFSLVTLFHYHPFIPSGWAFTLLGAGGIGAAAFLMRLLKTPRGGFVYYPEESTETNVMVDNVISIQISGTVPQLPSESQFGGGEFGGGGSGDAY